MAMLTQLLGRARAIWRVFWRSRQLERDMQDEMRFHVEMEAERLGRERDLAPSEARRQAHIRFGGIESHKEKGRDARGRRWLDVLAHDSRLGARMLVKHRGLTLVGGFAMAVAIGLGATAFEVLNETVSPLPIEDGDRVVAIRDSLVGAAAAGGVPREIGVWRERLTTIDELAAFRNVQQNLIAPPAPPGPIRLAEITASGFAIARTRPLMGRYLMPADEDATAPPVMVIGHRPWRTHFIADPHIVGRVVTLGGTARTIVGVMPEGFGFPIDHQYWIPFRVQPAARVPPSRTSIEVFGRLAAGVSIEQAKLELTTVAQGSSTDAPGSEPPRVAVVPFVLAHVDLADPGMTALIRVAQLLTGALTFVVAINLSILFYARTVTRSGELAVRSALGASRARLLSQLFLEALVLSLVGAACGLLLSATTLGALQSFVRAVAGAPYWLRFELSPVTAVNALLLAAFAALIMGVLPGLKATGRRVTASLHHLGGRNAPRLGPMWTTLVFAQVAAAVAVLPAACYLTWQTVRMELGGPGFAAERFAMTLVALPDDDGPGDPAVMGERQRTLMDRLRQEPGVAAVTFSSNVPGFAAGARIEFDAKTPVSAPAPWYVSRLDVATDMLDVYEADLLAGRRFTAADAGAAHTAVVNETFTKWISGGDNALGARFRYTERAGTAVRDQPWYEIVGVVRDFPRRPAALNLDTPAVVFHAAAPGTANPAILSIRFDGDVPTGFADRVRQLGTAIDPALLVRQAVPLNEYYDRMNSLWRTLSWSASIATLSVLLLSAAGMYALMSFTVAQRTREIGIRVALGARPRQLFVNIFGRATWQLGLGIVCGSLLSALAITAVGLEPALATGLLAAVALVMLAVGLLAAIGPARRSLRVHAAESLRSDG
jgi:predicted permease